MHSYYVVCLLSIVALFLGTEGNPASQYSHVTDHFASFGSLQSCVDSGAYNHIVIIDSKQGNQTCQHLPEGKGNSTVYCKTLEYALKQFQHTDSIVFYLASPNDTYFLNTTHGVIGRSGFALCGNASADTGSTYPTIQCGSHNGENNFGLFFSNSSNILISNVQFLYCSGEHNSSSKYYYSSPITIRAGIYIKKCTNVTMEHTQVLNGSQAIGLFMYNTDGVVVLRNCTFASNRVDENSQKHKNSQKHGGGGAAIEFTYSSPDDDESNNDTYYDSEPKQNKTSKYSIENCTFAMNRAYYPPSDIAPDNVALYRAFSHNAIGRGGGLSVGIKGDTENNTFKIDGCSFVNNSGLWGGALHISMSDDSMHNEVLLTGNTFLYNTAHNNGGGIDLFNHVHYDSDDSGARSKVYISNCTFFHNSALNGGALHFAVVPENIPTTNSLFGRCSRR